ncbi:MAG: 2-hydroxyacyl-CoA dehydratase [Deltaproteobacteria bacterium]|nr:2-hydroxyacyl-CoA dehydratase [Deltaproteobacteria bacterium]
MGSSRPIETTKRLPRLIRNQVIWSRIAKRIGRPVAWCTSGGPVELLLASGIVPFYPENHAAICSARGIAQGLAEKAEEDRFSHDLCSYFRIDYGSFTTGRTPLGGVLAPDLVLVSNNICGTVQNWFRVAADHFDVPFLFLDTPFSEEPCTENDVAYARDQLVHIARESARIAGRTFDEKRLVPWVERARDTVETWKEVMKTASAKPAPFTSFDAFVHMAPIVSMRGTRRALAYYRRLLAELRGRAKAGIAAVPNERARAVWDNIAIWPAHRELKKTFRDAGVALVADTYTGAWGGVRLDPTDPLTGLARAYCDVLLNHGVKRRTQELTGLVREYSADGFILHSNRSCKRYSLGQYAVRNTLSEATGVPGVIVEADMADPRSVSIDSIRQRLTPFFEMIGAHS